MKRKLDNAVIFYRDNYEQYKEDNPTNLYCLSDSTVDMLLSLLRYASWPTRWRLNENDNSGRVIGENWIDVSQWHELATREVVKNMSCELTEGFEALAQAIKDASNSDAIFALAKSVQSVADKPCCNDTVEVVTNVNGGVNGNLEDGTITYGTQPNSNKPEDVPDGFTDEAHFDAVLCNRAAAMVDGAIIGLGVWAGVETVGAIGVSVAFMLTVIGIITIPEVTIPTLIAFMAIGVLAAGSVYAVRQEVIAHRQELICIIYTGEGTSQITESLAELFDIIIGAANVAGPVAVAIKSVLMIFFSADTLNKLYDSFAGSSGVPADCSNCRPKYLSSYNGAVSHRDEFGGQQYGMSITSPSAMTGETDDILAVFDGSYWVDICGSFSGQVGPGTMTIEADISHVDILKVYTNTASGAEWNSSGWTFAFEGLTGEVVTEFTSIMIHTYGATGYNAHLEIDSVSIQ